MGKAMNPSVKRELSNLSEDPVSRRLLAMNNLKRYIMKQLDTNTLPIFLTHISEVARKFQVSRQYAVSLYEAVARKHGSHITPHVNIIMGSVVNVLSSTGEESIALQQACARLVCSIAKYTIYPTASATQKEEIIRSLCCPLLGNVQRPYLVAGASRCLHALVEYSQNWKFAPQDLINRICLQTTRALEKKGTQTVGHMQLICSLSKTNGRILQPYGRDLLKIATDILKAGVSNANGNWQQRLHAVHMINSLLKSIDREILCLETPKLIDVLQRRHRDRIPCIRNAAAEALHRANNIISSASEAISKANNSQQLVNDFPSQKSMAEIDGWCAFTSTPRSLVQSLQHQSSSEDSEIWEKQFANVDNCQILSRNVEWRVRHNPIANDRSDDRFIKLEEETQGRIISGFKRMTSQLERLKCIDRIGAEENELLERCSICSSNVGKSKTVSSISSGSISTENAEKPEQLRGIVQAGSAEILPEDVENSNMSSKLQTHRSLLYCWSKYVNNCSLPVRSRGLKKGRDLMEFILQGSLCVVLILPAAMAAIKYFIIPEVYHVLVPT